MIQNRFGAIVLAGGDALRFGRDKRVEDFGGTPMALHTYRIVSSVIENCCLSTATDALPEALRSVPHISDLWPGTGPLGAVTTALTSFDTEWVLCVAADTPYLTTDSLRRMVEACGAEHGKEVEAVIATDAAGRVHPLVACYRNRTAATASACMESNTFAMRGFISELHLIRYITLPDAELRNINRPVDLSEKG